MARLWHGGAELNSTGTSVEVTTNSGTVSISSTTVRSGTYSWRANPTAGTGFFRQQRYGSNQAKVGFLRVYFRAASLPNANNVQIVRFSDISNNNVASIRMDTDGTIGLFKSDNTLIGSRSSALSTNTWYRIELKTDATTSPGTLTGRIDGVDFATGSNSNQGQWARILWGAITPNSTTDMFFDDIALNDDQGSFQNSWPGDEKLIVLRPDSAGDANQWLKTAGGAGDSSNYQLVDEVTPNDATDFITSTTLNDVDMYNCGASGINSYDTVNVVTVHSRSTNNTADASVAFRVRVEKTSSGTVSEGTDVIPNSTTWQTDDAASTYFPQLVMYQDPDASAWTQTTLDSMQIGAKLSVDGTNNIRISALWAYVGYTPGSPPSTNTGFLAFM